MKSLIDAVTGKGPDPLKLETDLLEKIDAAIEEKIERRDKKINGFHPSATSECARYYVYLFRGVEVPPNHGARAQRIFDNGHSVHERIYGYLERAGILVGAELPIRFDDPPIEGTSDGVIEFNGPKLIELKSINDKGFNLVKQFHKAKDPHYKQAQTYIHCFRQDQYPNMAGGFVIYENKNTQELLTIYISYDEKFMAKVLKKYDKIFKAYQQGILPARPYKSKSSEACRYCDLRDMCWDDNEEGTTG